MKATQRWRLPGVVQDVPVAVTALTSGQRGIVRVISIQDLTNFTPGPSYATEGNQARRSSIVVTPYDIAPVRFGGLFPNGTPFRQIVVSESREGISSDVFHAAGLLCAVACDEARSYHRDGRRAIVDSIYNKASGGGVRPIRGTS